MITDAEWSEWERRTNIDRPDEEALADPLWRLASLYTIKLKDGRTEPFTPNREQIEVFIAIHVRGWTKIIIPKARQLGMSTAIVILSLDLVLFEDGFSAALVDKRGDDADKKMAKAQLAWEKLPALIRARFDVLGDSTKKFVVRRIGSDSAPSTYEVGTSYRGDTVQLLHLSEWGWIQAMDAKRSEEILTGSIPTAESGITIIETTWEGGEGGDVWPFMQEAIRGDSRWRYLFFPWFTCPDYTETMGSVDAETARYLGEVEQELSITFTAGQKRWYAGIRDKLKSKAKKEFPSRLRDCFSAPIEGAIYSEELEKLTANGDIGRFPYDSRYPVHTSWDLGSPLHTVVWYWQRLNGGVTRFIDCDYALDLKLDDRMRHMNSKGYLFGNHYVPHDSTQKLSIGSFFDSISSLCREIGCGKPIRVQRIPSKIDGIDYTRRLFAHFQFDEERCKKGVAGLRSYRWQPTSGSGITKDEPVHDWASHIADGLRTMAEAEMHGLVPTARNAATRPGTVTRARTGTAMSW